MAKFVSYSKEEIAYYNSSDISLVANSVGIRLNGKTDSKGWQRAIDNTGKHLSKLAFNLNSNSFHNFETGKSDKPIGFLMDWQGYSFPEAVTYLKENDFSKATDMPKVQTSSVRPKIFDYTFKISNDTSKLNDYLVNQRKISEELVSKLLKTNLIAQDDKNNIIFNYKKGSEIVGASIQGTYINYDKFPKRGTFKGIKENSEPNFGFHFSFGEPTKMMIFEAPIDALSHYTLKSSDRHNVMYAVETGYSKETVGNFINYAKSRGNSSITKDGVYISVDNDISGIRYWSEFASTNLKSNSNIFKNNLPDFHSVPKDILRTYQNSLVKYGGQDLAVEPLLAIHKFETNFDLSTGCANHMGYRRYFSEKGQSRDISVEERNEKIDRLVKNYVHYKGNIRNTITSPVDSQDKNNDFEMLVRDLSSTYETKMIAKNMDEIQKDWNDVLKHKTKMNNQVYIDVSTDEQLEDALRSLDYNQIAHHDLEAAGIHNRKDAKAYEESHEAEL